MNVGEYILYLYLCVPDVLFQQVNSVFGFQWMKPIETTSFVFHSSLEFLQTIIGRFHLAMNLLRKTLQALQAGRQNSQ